LSVLGYSCSHFDFRNNRPFYTKLDVDSIKETPGPYILGKAVPLQAWSCPEGSRKLRFPVYMTTVQDGGKVVSLTHRPPLPPGNARGTHLC
jgi:hypothetical protein